MMVSGTARCISGQVSASPKINERVRRYVPATSYSPDGDVNETARKRRNH